MRRVAAGAILILLAVSVPAGGGEDPSSPRDGTPTFTDVAVASGINGGGSFFAWGDYDKDNDEDLLVDGNRLYRNEGPPSWSFTDVTVAAFGSPSGALGGTGNWGDFDGDGYLDLYSGTSPGYGNGAVCGDRVITNYAWDVLWRNNQDGTFTNVTVAYGNVYDNDVTTVTAWADVDRDGYLDLFVGGGEDWFECPAGSGQAYARYFPDRLYHNDAGFGFTDVTATALGTIEINNPKYARGATFGDFDNDGWLDLYVTNYRQQLNYLYRNTGGGVFSEIALPLASQWHGLADAPVDATNNPDPCNRPGHGVGSSWGDYDNDGDLDLIVGTFNHKDWRTSDDTQLWRNDGAGPGFTFTNVRATAGIPVKPYDTGNPPCGAQPIFSTPDGDELIVGAAWGDVDSDGDLDLWMPQIYDITYAYSYLYLNDGDGTFTEAAASAGVRVYDTYGGAFADYDQDGDVDLVTGGRLVGQVGAPSAIRLFRNNGVAGGHQWIEARLKACGAGINTGVVGARLHLTAGANTYIRNVEAGQSSHSSMNSLVQHFGLGHFAGTDADLAIDLPDGRILTRNNLALNQIHDIDVNCPVGPVLNATADLTGGSLQHVTLAWEPPQRGTPQNYAVYYSTTFDPNEAGYDFLAEIPAGTLTYTHQNAGKGNPNTYFYQVYANGTLTSTPSIRQLAKYAATIPPGPNLLSIPIEPIDANTTAVFRTLDQYTILRSYNATDAGDPWKSKRSGGPDYDLGEIRPGMGVWYHSDAFAFQSFVVTGWAQPTTSVYLQPGWNLVGYTSFTARNATAAFAGTSWTAVEAFDGNAFPYQLRRLAATDTLVTGSAYWVHATAAGWWTVTY